MVVNPSGSSGVVFLKKGGVPSVCLLEILHRGSKACYGLDVNVGACTMTGLKSELRVA